VPVTKPTAAGPQTSAGQNETVQNQMVQNEVVQQILDAGSAWLTRFGNEKTTIQDVAQTSGISRATIYRYFPGRAQLLQAITDYDRARRLQEVRIRAAAAASLEQALAIAAEVLWVAALRFRTSEHLANRDRGLAHYLLFQHADRLEWITELVHPYVQRAHEGGELGPDVSLDDAIGWTVMTLSAIPMLSGSGSGSGAGAGALDIGDPPAMGRLLARRICRGLS
jgi:AcrR family transcriptional regulator